MSCVSIPSELGLETDLAGLISRESHNDDLINRADKNLPGVTNTALQIACCCNSGLQTQLVPIV